MVSRRPDLSTLLPALAGTAELHLARSGATARELEPLRALVALTRLALEPKPVNLNTTVRRAEPLLARLVGPDVTLSTLPVALRASVLADPGELEHALANVVANAAEASRPGGRVTVETANVTVGKDRASGTLAPGTYVMLGVSDDGAGMDRQTAERALEPLFSTKDGSPRGLGLTVAYGIVRQLGGDVSISSEEGQGTSVKLYLPLADAPGVADTAETEGGSGTILLADDNEQVRGWAREVLELYGYSVLEAADGEKALEVASGHDGDIDLLVTDVVMPALGGPELAERLATARPGLRVLLISGYTDRGIVEHGVLPRDARFLQKPFSASALGEAVRELLA
jgi:two-component system cell cycle sensor histidine kinase/response regulator CckA